MLDVVVSAVYRALAVGRMLGALILVGPPVEARRWLLDLV